MAARAAKRGDPLRVVSQLIETGKVDTVYRDVYLARARTLLDGILSYLVMADGRLRALVGGNARFGGLYDLLGLSRDYDSDRVVARFAVVHRERMAAW
jgi:hypothetical protein